MATARPIIKAAETIDRIVRQTNDILAPLADKIRNAVVGEGKPLDHGEIMITLGKHADLIDTLRAQYRDLMLARDAKTPQEYARITLDYLGKHEEALQQFPWHTHLSSQLYEVSSGLEKAISPKCELLMRATLRMLENTPEEIKQHADKVDEIKEALKYLIPRVDLQTDRSQSAERTR